MIIDIGFVGTRESAATAALFTYLRKKYPKAFIWKIPDIGNKLKPCDGICFMEDGKTYMIEVKILKTKETNISNENYKKMFVPLMEPLQVLTFDKCSKLGIQCVMLGYSIHTHLYYFYIY